MSQYLSTTEREMVQIASNMGWSEFCDWVDTTEIDDYPWMHNLVLHGFANDAESLADEIETAIEDASPSKDVASVAEGIVEFARGHEDAEIIIVSNGMTIGNGGDDEDEGTDDDDDDFDDEEDDEDEDEEDEDLDEIEDEARDGRLGEPVLHEDEGANVLHQ